jgi:hypothetical protein
MPTITHVLSDETGQEILEQLTAIREALDAGALSNAQISTVLSDGTPTGSGFLDGGGLKAFFDGLKAKFTKENLVDGNAIAPSSVNATGAIQGTSISDGTGTLAQLRESVSPTPITLSAAQSDVNMADITKCYKIGRIVIASVNFKDNTPVKNEAIISGFPNPKSIVCISATAGTTPVLLKVVTGGNLIWDANMVSGWAGVSFAYVSAS